MKQDWLEIYNIIDECIKYKVLKSADQHEVGNCFKILSCRKTNSTLQTQLTTPIWNNNFIRPDIVLQKENENELFYDIHHSQENPMAIPL